VLSIPNITRTLTSLGKLCHSSSHRPPLPKWRVSMNQPTFAVVLSLISQTLQRKDHCYTLKSRISFYTHQPSSSPGSAGNKGSQIRLRRPFHPFGHPTPDDSFEASVKRQERAGEGQWAASMAQGGGGWAAHPCPTSGALANLWRDSLHCSPDLFPPRSSDFKRTSSMAQYPPLRPKS